MSGNTKNATNTAASTLPGSSIPASKITVLHIDDDPQFCDLTSNFLQREDDQFNVLSENTLAGGLDALDSRDIDCIVSDYDLPEGNGVEFLKTVRANNPDIPFILFTGKGSEEVASEAISAGVSDYLQKEGGTDQYAILSKRIRNLVEKFRAERLVERAFKAMDRSREGIALLDESGEFIYINERYTEIVGYSPAELIGEFWTKVYPEAQVQRIHEEILETVPEEGHWTGDTVYERKDGSRVAVNHALAYSEEGTMICLIRDLTDSDAQDRALDEQRQRFDLFINAVEDYAIFMLDPDGYIVSWNTGAERIKGYSEDEILGQHFSTFYTEEQRDAGVPAQLLKRAMEDGVVEDKGLRVRRDGTTFMADVVITAVYDEDGHHRGFGKVTRNLREH